MEMHNIYDVDRLFEVLQTTQHSQTAVMILTKDGEQSSEEMNVHKTSDQVVLLVEGEMLAEIAEEKREMKSGDSCIVPAGTPHRFTNRGNKRAVSFNIYAPPEYSPGKTFDA